MDSLCCPTTSYRRALRGSCNPRRRHPPSPRSCQDRRRKISSRLRKSDRSPVRWDSPTGSSHSTAIPPQIRCTRRCWPVDHWQQTVQTLDGVQFSREETDRMLGLLCIAYLHFKDFELQITLRKQNRIQIPLEFLQPINTDLGGLTNRAISRIHGRPSTPTFQKESISITVPDSKNMGHYSELDAEFHLPEYVRSNWLPPLRTRRYSRSRDKSSGSRSAHLYTPRVCVSGTPLESKRISQEVKTRAQS
ncbi:hypothetical protein BKA80DRAFT_42307 [Phyllosticta citrichinensis]